MHVLTLTEPLPLGKTLGDLGAGEWVVTDQHVFEMGNMAARGTATARPMIALPTTHDDGRPDLIMRTGAIGDLLMLTPVLHECLWKTGMKINLCCFPHHFPLFEGNNDITSLVPYPLALSEVYRYRQIFSLENMMECDHTRHPTDIFHDALRLEPGPRLAGYKPVYHLKASEIINARQSIFSNRPNIALQLKASVANRDYPLPQWLAVIQGLERRGWGVLLLGARGQISPMPPHVKTPFIRDLSAIDLPLRESAAVLSLCDAFIGIDSAFLHFAHAFDIPAIGLYGPFRWQVRTGGAPNIRAISGTGDCAGCGWHRHNGNIYPPNKPCSTARHCVVLASIQPERVVAAAEKLKPKTHA